MPLKVLYLDDEKELCENFSELYESNEVKIITFCEPQKAIDAAIANPPDLILVDYRLPSTNGDKVAQAINLDVPVILVTGEISVATTYKFAKILSKPFKDEEILSLLNEYLALSKSK